MLGGGGGGEMNSNLPHKLAKREDRAQTFRLRAVVVSLAVLRRENVSIQSHGTYSRVTRLRLATHSSKKSLLSSPPPLTIPGFLFTAFKLSDTANDLPRRQQKPDTCPLFAITEQEQSTNPPTPA